MAPKSGVPFKKVLQKVEHPLLVYKIAGQRCSKKGVKKWSTFSQMAPKSGVPFQKVLQKVEHLYYIGGFRGHGIPLTGCILDGYPKCVSGRGQGFALDSEGS